MKKIEKGIVFSNDIERILKGNNSLEFNYQEKGMVVPSADFLNSLRADFKKDITKIFGDNFTILSEEEMIESLYSSISDIEGRYPHCIA